MVTFEEFAKQFDINKPAEYQTLMKQYQHWLDALDVAYCKRWTWCGGCHKTVRFDLATVANETFAGKTQRITRCPEWGAIWFIRDIDVRDILITQNNNTTVVQEVSDGAD